MRRAVAVFVVVLSAVAAQAPQPSIFFSRRVYQSRGKTYQQIWKLDLATGRMTQLSHTPRDHELLACSANAKEITFSDDGYMDNASRWSFDIATGQERRIGKSPDCPPRPDKLISPDRSKTALTRHEYVLIEDARAGKQLWKVNLNQPTLMGFEGPVATPIEWTLDSKKLLLGAVGQNTNSSSPQSDYFVLDTTTGKLQRAGTGNDGQWIPGRNAIIYDTPRDLCPVSHRSRYEVWCAQLAIFDLDTGKEKLLTSGTMNNIDPIICSN